MKLIPICFSVVTVLSACGDSKTIRQTGVPTSKTNDQGDPINNKNHEIAFPWEAKGPVFKAKVWIGDGEGWLASLGIPKNSQESVVVNAANGGLGGGGGIDGALCKWANTYLGKPFTTWRVGGAKLPNGSMAPDPLPTGEFALFDTPFGWIYLAVGPIASQVSSLDEAKQKVSTLYKAMLEQANKDKIKRIVLPAISTDIFAGGGKGFSKEAFIKAVYQGMIGGIENFQKDNPTSTLLIIVNNWDPNIVSKVPSIS